MVLEIPPGMLSPDVLERVIEEFVTRQSAGDGALLSDLGERVCAVRRQIAAGTAILLFDDETQQTHIAPVEVRAKLADKA